MLQANVKKSDIKYFVDLKLTGFKLEEFSYSMLFGFDKEMTVNTHWELVDQTDGKILDSGIALKNREQLLLFKLIGKKLINFKRDSYLVELFFEDNLKLMVY